MNSKQREVLGKIAENIDRTLSILNEIPESCSHNGLVEDAADVLCLIKETYIPEALSAPRRNCDVYDLTRAKAEYKKYRIEICLRESNPFIANDETLPFNKWLYAEAKGETE